MSERRILEAYEGAGGLIDDILLGRSNWFALSGFLADRFPGAFSAVIDIGAETGTVDILSSHGMEESYRDSFQDYYCRINPWNEIWTKRRSPILVTQAEAPAERFARTEFYNDWLRPQKHFDAGVGMRIPYAESNVLYLTVHSQAMGPGNHDREAQQLFGLLHKDLRFRLGFAQSLAARSSSLVASHVVDSHDAKPALIIDRDLRIRDANPLAVRELRSGIHIRDKAGVLSFSNLDHQREATRLVAALTSGTETVRHLYLKTASTTLVVRASLIRARPDNMAMSPEHAPSILITLANAGERVSVSSDLAEAFRLTAAEFALCLELASGLILTEAAVKLGIRESTARQRLKSILAKTGTSRQSELMRLMLT